MFQRQALSLVLAIECKLEGNKGPCLQRGTYTIIKITTLSAEKYQKHNLIVENYILFSRQN